MMKKDVTIDYFDPARTTLTRRDSLNILLIASNHTDTPLCPEITIYGDDGEQTVPLYSRHSRCRVMDTSTCTSVCRKAGHRRWQARRRYGCLPQRAM